MNRMPPGARAYREVLQSELDAFLPRREHPQTTRNVEAAYDCLPAGVLHNPAEPTGAEKLAAALAARTEPGRAPEAVVYAPEAVDQAIADVRTQVEQEAKKREEEGVTLEGGHGNAELQRAGAERRRQGRSKGIHGKPCPKCPRRNGPRSRVCACGHRYAPEQKKVGKPIVIARRRRNRG